MLQYLLYLKQVCLYYDHVPLLDVNPIVQCFYVFECLHVLSVSIFHSGSEEEEVEEEVPET